VLFVVVGAIEEIEGLTADSADNQVIVLDNRESWALCLVDLNSGKNVQKAAQCAVTDEGSDQRFWRVQTGSR